MVVVLHTLPMVHFFLFAAVLPSPDKAASAAAPTVRTAAVRGWFESWHANESTQTEARPHVVRLTFLELGCVRRHRPHCCRCTL